MKTEMEGGGRKDYEGLNWKTITQLNLLQSLFLILNLTLHSDKKNAGGNLNLGERKVNRK